MKAVYTRNHDEAHKIGLAAPTRQHLLLGRIPRIRRHRCCEELILRVTQSVSDGFQATEPSRTVAAFLDYSKAYDRVYRQDLIITMFETGVPLQILRWVNAFLQNRQARVLFNGTLSNKKKMLQGLPQGSVLAPLLFLFMG